MTTINIYDPICVQYGTLKKELYPYETLADISFSGQSVDDCVRIYVCPDEWTQVGLTVERLRRKVTFANTRGIPNSATAFRNGVPLGNDDQVLPGNVIEFVRRRELAARRRAKRSKTASLRRQSDTDHTDEPTESIRDFVFAFDAVRRQWHVRFQHGQQADEVEEDWLPNPVGMRYIAYCLERPDEQILCTEIFPPLAAQAAPKNRRHKNTISSQIGSEDAAECAEDQQSDQESRTAAWKAAKQTRDEWRQQMRQVAEEIKEAREADDEKTAVRLETTFAYLEQQYNSQFDRNGRERTFVNNADQSAANRVRNGIQRVLDKCLDRSPRKKYALNRFAEHIDKVILYHGGYARYADTKHWHVVYPPYVK